MKKIVDLFSDVNWEEVDGYGEGTKQKVLREDNSAKTILLKIPKDFHVARHAHETIEQFLVLKGEYICGNEVYPEGSYKMFNANEEHGPFETKDGALVLFIWNPISN